MIERARNLLGTAPEWLRVFVFGSAVILGGLALTFHPLFHGDRSDLAGRYDVYHTVGPVTYFMDYALHRGEIPWWNPLTFCGMPFAGNPLVSFFYPPNLLRSALTFHPSPYNAQLGWIAMMAAHLWLGGLSLAYLARRHGLSYGASFLAALVFVLGAVWVRRVSEYHFIIVVGWLPLLLLLTCKALEDSRHLAKLFLGLLAGLILGCTLLTGALNLMPYMGVAIGMHALAYRLLNWRPSVGPIRGQLRVLAGDAIFLGVLFGVGGLLGAALLLPGQELAGFSSRTGNSAFEMVAPHYAGTWTELYHTLIRYPGLKWEPENIRGAGVAAAVLALLGLAAANQRKSLVYAILSFVLFDCAMGRPWPFATVVDILSPIQMVSSTRAFDIAMVPLGLMAGFGADAVTRGRLRGWRILVGVAALAAGGAMLYALVPLVKPETWMTPGPVAVALPATALAVIFMAYCVPAGAFWRTCLLVLFVAETFSWNLSYVQYLLFRPNFYEWAGKFEGGAPWWEDNRRDADPLPNRHLYSLDGVMNGYEPVHIARVRNVTASPSKAQRYFRQVNKEEVTGDNIRGNLFLKRVFWLASEYAVGDLPNRIELFPSATTVFLSEDPGWPVRRVERAAISKSAVSELTKEVPYTTGPAAAPLALTAGPAKKKWSFTRPKRTHSGKHSALVFTYTATGRGILAPRFTDPGTGEWTHGRKVALRQSREGATRVELPLPDYNEIAVTLVVDKQVPNSTITLQDIAVVEDLRDEGELIEIVERRTNGYDLRIGPLAEHRILTCIDAAYPGWHAYVDGNETPVVLANEAFKAILVPPGSHDVSFVYRPERAYGGLAITLGTMAVVFVLLCVLPAIISRQARREIAAPIPSGSTVPG